MKGSTGRLSHNIKSIMAGVLWVVVIAWSIMVLPASATNNCQDLCDEWWWLQTEESLIIQMLRKTTDWHSQRDAEGITPLHLAAKWNRHSIISILLDAGVNINLVNQKNETALHFAARYGAPETVVLLLAAGADPAIRNSDNKTAADLARHYNPHIMLAPAFKLLDPQQQKPRPSP